MQKNMPILTTVLLSSFLSAQTISGNSIIQFGSNAIYEDTWDSGQNPGVGDSYRYTNVVVGSSFQVDAIFTIQSSTFDSNNNPSPNGFGFQGGTNGSDQLRSATWGGRTGANSLVRAGTGGVTFQGNFFGEGEVIYASNSRFATASQLNNADITNFTQDSSFTGIQNNAFIDLQGRQSVVTGTPNANNTANLSFRIQFVNADDNDETVTLENFQITFFDIDGAPNSRTAEFLEVRGASQYIVDNNTYLTHGVSNGNIIAYADPGDSLSLSNSLADAYRLSDDTVERQGNTGGNNDLNWLVNQDGVDGFSALAAQFNNVSEFEVVWGFFTDTGSDEHIPARGLWMDGGDHIELIFNDPIVIPEVNSLVLMSLAGLALVIFRRFTSRKI